MDGIESIINMQVENMAVVANRSNCFFPSQRSDLVSFSRVSMSNHG